MQRVDIVERIANHEIKHRGQQASVFFEGAGVELGFKIILFGVDEQHPSQLHKHLRILATGVAIYNHELQRIHILLELQHKRVR